jgi:ribosome production factor 2
MKKPDAIWYKRKEANKVLPFEDASTIEFYSNRSDASLFMFGSNTKKRPNNLVVGRMFGWKLLDMLEFGVSNFKSSKEFGAGCQGVGSKPMFVLAGEQFQTEEVYRVAANLLVDFFRGRVVDRINIQGLDHVIQLTVVDGVIHFAHYSVKLKKSGTQIPKIHLEEIGPSMDLSLRRSKLGSEDLRKESLRTPAQLNPSKQKNISRTALGDTVGRLHVPNQEIDKIVTKKPKGLKRHLVDPAEASSSSPATKKQKTREEE